MMLPVIKQTLEGHQNLCICSKVTLILLSGWILPTGGASSGMFCASSLRSMLAFSKHLPSGPILFVSQSVRLSVCLSVCLFTFEVPFQRLFYPTSQSLMSNIFRASESLGKSNWKKWSHIWPFLFENCQKSPSKKKFFLLILPYKTWWKPRFPMD